MKSLCQLKLLLITLLYVNYGQTKILRNNALMNKMMTHFHNNNNENAGADPSTDPETEPPPPVNHTPPTKILSLMQKVLCRNFPTIPCNLIVQDRTLRKLMERSIQQISYKKLNLDKTTQAPGFDLTLFPTINSEDLSKFLEVSHTGFFKQQKEKKEASSNTSKRKKNKNNKNKLKNFWSHENTPRSKIKNVKDANRPELYSNRKKMRKFYPHKIKYKDKNAKKSEFRDYSDEKLSMSVEVPDFPVNKKKEQMAYKVESDDPPVWRIDYMKHGEPSLNMFDYKDDRLRGKIMQTGPNVIVDENVLEQAARKEVLHPDVYIKKNFNHKTSGVNVNSEGVD